MPVTPQLVAMGEGEAPHGGKSLVAQN
jgi:hypothetical protein